MLNSKGQSLVEEAITGRPAWIIIISFIIILIVISNVVLFGEGEITAPDPEDMLDKNKCVQLLAELRHAKWFQVR